MDPIELMAIKPQQINRALGVDRVKVVRGSRKLYDYRQCRARRGLELKSDSVNDALETRPVFKCIDVACGGIHSHKHQIRKDLTTTESQTDPIDSTRYWDTDEVLKLHNLTILTGHPRDIEVNVVRATGGNKNVEIHQSGSSAVNATQINMLRQRNPDHSRFMKFLHAVQVYFTSLLKPARPPLKDASSSWSIEDQLPPNDPMIERDHEWMEFTSSEKSLDDIQADYDLAQVQNPPAQTRIEMECYQLMRVMNPLWWILKCGGRWPFETYVEDRLYKFRLKKWTPGFCVFILTTSFLLFCTSVGLGNITYLVQTSNLTGNHQSQVEKVLFNKYWPYAVVTLMYSGYACIWSLATIFDDGHFLAQFMSRWNLAVSVIRYDPTELALYEIWLSLGWLIFYCVTLFVLLIWDLVPVVRGTSDLLGMLTIGSFATDVNVEEHFLAVRVFGFLFHLYAVYSARVVTLWILMYCKFLENLARLWNLRFCYAFGMLGRYKSPNRYITYYTVVPFTKLFAEHKLITSFSRYTGKIFVVTLNFYFLLKGLEMITLGYILFSEVVLQEPESNETQTSLPCPTQNCEEILYKDARVYAVMSILYFTFQSFLGWYITCEGISDCGRSIMSGYNFVRRLGFSRCRNSKERRFIHSLQFTFAPITNYYLDIGYPINRKFIYDMFAYVFLVITLVVLSSPIRLQPQPIVFCTQSVNGTQTCVAATVPRLNIFKLFTESRDEFLKITSDIVEPVGTPEPDTPEPPAPPVEPPPAPPVEPPPAPPVEPPPAPPVEPPPAPPVEPPPAPPVEPPPAPPVEPPPAPPASSDCDEVLVSKERWSIVEFCKCSRSKAETEVGKDIYVPVMCNGRGELEVPFSKGSTRDRRKCSPFRGDHEAFQTIPYHFGPNSPERLPLEELYNCRTRTKYTREFGNILRIRDDCGGLPLSANGDVPRLRKVTVVGGERPPYECCCYDYAWYRRDGRNPSLSNNNCGVMNSRQARICPKMKCFLSILSGRC